MLHYLHACTHPATGAPHKLRHNGGFGRLSSLGRSPCVARLQARADAYEWVEVTEGGQRPLSARSGNFSSAISKVDRECCGASNIRTHRYRAKLSVAPNA